MAKVQICACVAGVDVLKCGAFRVTEDGENPPLTRNRDGSHAEPQSGDDPEQQYMTISRFGWGIGETGQGARRSRLLSLPGWAQHLFTYQLYDNKPCRSK